MRLWMVDPKILCRKHLLGEHVECHMFLGTLKKKLKMDGYISNNLFEPKSLQTRHDALVSEMINRGYNHNSPLEVNPELIERFSTDIIIDVSKSLNDLLGRCPLCKELSLALVK